MTMPLLNINRIVAYVTD